MRELAGSGMPLKMTALTSVDVCSDLVRFWQMQRTPAKANLPLPTVMVVIYQDKGDYFCGFYSSLPAPDGSPAKPLERFLCDLRSTLVTLVDVFRFLHGFEHRLLSAGSIALKEIAEVTAIERAAPRKRLAPRSKTNRKRPRNFPYMMWVKTLPCAVCGRRGSEACHTGPRGLGQKSPDEQCIPLCPDHHRHRRDALDVAGPRNFEAIHGIDIKELVVRLNKAWGLLHGTPEIEALAKTNGIGYV